MSGGGGSSSGNVNYPIYMKATHGDWLASGYSAYIAAESMDSMTYSVVDLMNSAMRDTSVEVTNSPYNSLTAVDPDGAFFDTAHSLSDYTGQSAFELLQLFLAETPESLYSSYTTVSYIDPDNAFFNTAHSLSDYAGQSAYELLDLLLAETPESLYTAYATDAAATAMIAAFSADLATEYAANIIPNYNRGYTDINATMSSAYTIGLTHIAAQQTREVAKFTGEIKTNIAALRVDLKEKWRALLSQISLENVKAYIALKNTETEIQSKTAMQRIQLKMEWRRLLSTLSVENSRIYLASKHEETEDNADYATKNNLWDLEIYQYGNQVMAAIAGASTVKSGQNTKPSVLGAGISGAAMGAMAGAQIGAAGGPIGAGTGALIGGAIGLASAL